MDGAVAAPVLHWVARRLRMDPVCWPKCAERQETRRGHPIELRAYLGLAPFGLRHLRQAVHALTELALQTDRGVGWPAVHLTCCAVATSSRLRST